MNNEDQTSQGTADFYTPEVPTETDAATEAKSVESISWSASEFMHHQKSVFWYVMAVAVLASVSLLYFILMKREILGSVAIFILGALLMVSAGRKPRTMSYLVDSHGIVVGQREYSYDDFQSFAIIQEDSIESILLTPQKRWSPALTIYFDPNDAQKIFETISTYIPLEDRQKDNMDKFLHKIRF